MKNRNKKYAIQLLIEKLSDPLLTYADIAEKTNYSIPQLKRLYKQVKEAENVSSLLVHKNKGSTPINKASDFEIKFLRSLKEKYPIITISHFRDIFIEDILENPDYSSFVNQHHLKPRSLSWFRSLFMKEGWKSPAKRKPLRRDGRSVHPLRKPAAQKGLLIQLDGTPFDWLGNGEMWTLHLAVDDATSEPLAGWFFPSERQLGYCHVMRLITEKHGIPMSLYTDKHSIFRNNNDQYNLTQFGMMMESLGIEMIFANTPQAKGRIERYNGTLQYRLPNDIIRFGIQSYNELNIWFNDFYIPYLSKKFAYIPLDPNSAFIPVDNIDFSKIFCLKYTRTIKEDMFSLNGDYYTILDRDNKPIHIINDTKVNIRVDVFTEQVYVDRYGKEHKTKRVFCRKKTKSELMENQKNVTEFLNNYRKNDTL